MGNAYSIEVLQDQVRKCRICIEHPVGTPLPHAPRPVAVLSNKAPILIIGQAPGTRVHASGRPFTDPSGDRLRDWMGIDETQFYDRELVAITPMGFCFPGLDARGSDLPPRKECAPHWQEKVHAAMPQVKLVLLIGMYAQAFHLGKFAKRTLTETVRDWRAILHSDGSHTRIPLPHPSWRNNAWIRKNPWFETDLLPSLQESVARALNGG